MFNWNSASFINSSVEIAALPTFTATFVDRHLPIKTKPEENHYNETEK